MAEANGHKQSQAVWIVPLLVLALIIGLAVIWRVLQITPKSAPEAKQEAVLPEQPPIIQSSPIGESQLQPSLGDILRIRKHWNPAFPEWVGRKTPDFDIVDINGKAQKLSSHKGKVVMLVFWATWCPPCRAEIPNLIETRKQISPDKLAIISVTYEESENVRTFASEKGINYPVIAALPKSFPVPYSNIDSIPTTFFIDKDGIVRLVTAGLVLPKETDLILKTFDI